MRARLRDETGATLIAAVLVVIAMLGLGVALLAAADGQSKSAASERTRESSFNLAEAAMNAQSLQLTRVWPSVAVTGAAGAQPCTPATTYSYCPQASAISNGYANGDYGVACASAPTTPAWETTIRDGTAGEQQWTSAVTGRAKYDANADGVIWLRSTATTRCHKLSMVSLVSQTQIPITVPSNVVTANWFQTSNQGRKVIVDTRGSAAQPSPIMVRCSGKTTAQCLNYPADKGQVQPPATRQDSTAPTSTLTDDQIAALEAQAASVNRLYAAGTCSLTAAQLASVNGAPVVVKGGPTCNVSVTGNTSINSAAVPGVLIVEDGSLQFGGSVQFYGLIIMLNKSNSSASLLNIGGNATVHGGVIIDGNGGITAGSSKTNLIFDPRASTLVKGAAGATLNKNTFRVVPTGA
jgi:Tfp pilus assembly protein PilX